MSENTTNPNKITVVKRDGKKVKFNKAKIAIAIKKGFDSIKLPNGENKYSEKDISKVLNNVLDKIYTQNPEKIKIEEIQDLIEASLKEEKYIDVSEKRHRSYWHYPSTATASCCSDNSLLPVH